MFTSHCSDMVLNGYFLNDVCLQRYEVTFSMLEIYNEKVRDLLTKENPKGGLPVRQTPDSAFFVQGLKYIPVGSYREISKRMEQGYTLFIQCTFHFFLSSSYVTLWCTWNIANDIAVYLLTSDRDCIRQTVKILSVRHCIWQFIKNCLEHIFLAIYTYRPSVSVRNPVLVSIPVVNAWAQPVMGRTPNFLHSFLMNSV